MIEICLLLAAGFLAGAMNAVAGGGTFVALPALAFVGLTPTLANISTTVALFPGVLASTWAYRRDFTSIRGTSTRALLVLSGAGGLLGAILLLLTTERAFTYFIPWLLLLATATLAAGPRLSLWLRGLGLHAGPRTMLTTQLALGTYGGYFGGAVGLMMLAAWSLTTSMDLRSLNSLRTMSVAAANGAAVVYFALTGHVSWHECLIVMTGSIAGGYTGARLGRRLPDGLLRVLVLTIAIGTTTAFFIHAYFI